MQKKGFSEGDELKVVSIRIEEYEFEHIPVGLPDPIEKFRMEQLGYNQVAFFRAKTQVFKKNPKSNLILLLS